MMSFGFSPLRLQALRRHCMRVLHLPGTCTRQDLAKVVGAAAAFSSEIDPKDKVYSWSAGSLLLTMTVAIPPIPCGAGILGKVWCSANSGTNRFICISSTDMKI